MMLSVFHFYLKLSQVLGVVPWININTFELFDKIPYKIYPAALTFILSIAPFMRIISSQDIQHISLFVLACATGFTNLQSTYTNRTEWKKFCQLYKVINKQISPESLDSLDLVVKYFGVMAFYILIFLSIRSVVYYNQIGVFNLFVDLLMFIKLIRDCLTIYFLLMLTKGFKLVSKHSKNLLNEDLENNIGFSIFSRTTPTFCRKLYTNLYEMSLCVNNIFGSIMATNLLIFIIRMNMFFQKIIVSFSEREYLISDIYFVILVSTYNTVSYLISTNFRFVKIK